MNLFSLDSESIKIDVGQFDLEATPETKIEFVANIIKQNLPLYDHIPNSDFRVLSVTTGVCLGIIESLRKPGTYQAAQALEDHLVDHQAQVWDCTEALWKQFYAPKAPRGWSPHRLLYPLRRPTNLYLAAKLHDTGKIGVPWHTLMDVKLDKDDLVEVKKHGRYSVEILEQVGLSNTVLDLIETHHEREDGRGYLNIQQNRLTDEQKILIWGDTLAASIRKYNRHRSPWERFDNIRSSVGTQLSPIFFPAFVRCIDEDQFMAQYFEVPQTFVDTISESGLLEITRAV